jgi:hypothetical protein
VAKRHEIEFWLTSRFKPYIKTGVTLSFPVRTIPIGLARSMHQKGCFVRHRSGRERSAGVEPGGQELAVATRWGWRRRARGAACPLG